MLSPHDREAASLAVRPRASRGVEPLIPCGLLRRKGGAGLLDERAGASPEVVR